MLVFLNVYDAASELIFPPLFHVLARGTCIRAIAFLLDQLKEMKNEYKRHLEQSMYLRLRSVKIISSSLFNPNSVSEKNKPLAVGYSHGLLVSCSVFFF